MYVYILTLSFVWSSFILFWSYMCINCVLIVSCLSRVRRRKACFSFCMYASWLHSVYEFHSPCLKIMCVFILYIYSFLVLEGMCFKIVYVQFDDILSFILFWNYVHFNFVCLYFLIYPMLKGVWFNFVCVHLNIIIYIKFIYFVLKLCVF